MEEITRLFDGIKMPEDCTRRIAGRLEIAGSNKQEGHIVMQKPESGMNRRGIAGALACLALVAVAGMAALGGGSAETTVPTGEPTNITAEQMQQELESLKQQIEEQEEAMEEGAVATVITIDDWLEEEGSRLYFCAEENRIHWEDITEKISLEKPYLYSCVQEDESVLIIAIGGEYDVMKGIKSIGWYAAVWDGEGYRVRGENYHGMRWYEVAVEGLAAERRYALQKAAAKADFENGLHYTEGNITYTYTPGGDRTEYDTSLHTPFTEFVDGRVYFTANGENLDITDQFSEEEPFTYIFTDSHLLTHYIAIGGTPENPGYLEMIQMNWSVGFGASCGGMGVNTWNNEADARYGWETRAKEIFEPYGVYWAS